MATIKFVDDDLTVNAAVGQNLRDIAQNEGSTIPFGCELGVCGTCLSRVQAPEGAISSMEEQEKETLEALGAEVDCRLVCQCRVEKDDDITITSAH
ncbi:MAG: (2Fe-2S)-binding protein [Candidatus Kerfeldbacteria bacterium]|nr:(2Fe-2S)-binding protein [Candidatus Kerfeldbacteria bacterium]